MTGQHGSIGFLALAAWVFSVVAAVMAIDMYALLRTGEFGRSWRVIIIASVILTFTLAVRLGEIVDFRGMAKQGLSQIGALMFVMALAYAIYLQRQVFAKASRLRRRATDTQPDVAAMSLRRDPGPEDPDAVPPRSLLRRQRSRPEIEDDDTSDIEWSAR